MGHTLILDGDLLGVKKTDTVSEVLDKIRKFTNRSSDLVYMSHKIIINVNGESLVLKDRETGRRDFRTSY
ncbi:hypothetical protein [Aeromonas phage PZL-Ah152]|uniref:Uncharacterized protein n=1 Tax=Aeromonas phage PZL-Ah152 TaxID=2820393 RepID=A0A8A6C5X8_9CAUD|nr:hypothetical protein [Aeromonas phage PZL-Ah152]